MSWIRNLYQRFYAWGPSFLGLLCVGIAMLFKAVPSVAESLYRNTIFAGFRWVRDALFNWIPIPLMLIILILLFLWLAVGWYRKRLFGFRPWYRGILNALGILITWFYVSWGWNYSAPGVVDKLSLNLDDFDRDARQELILASAEQCLDLGSSLDSSLVLKEDVTPEEVNTIHAAVRNTLRDMGVRTPGNVKMNLISESGWMRKWGVAGIYMPFSGEAHADASYLALQEWFIVAHEFTHGYGITDEGECNFIAFETLRNSGNPQLEYAAWFNLYDELVPTYDSTFIELYPALHQHQLALRQNARSHRQYAPKVAQVSNDIYLKSQGVKKGVRSYRGWMAMVYSRLED
ncbi:MAG: DUF3810 domain-containing protein [Flavobacteriales bacterium]|nr:DUF3810 domain-containing protein [Flavobacteriales bacterium]